MKSGLWAYSIGTGVHSEELFREDGGYAIG
jgi:hypothetical protein